ncbi:MAG: adenine phosphoribosyltransferase [Pseudomonadota bacterium]|nr:adenine phosphoribosyltransferase [Pseudomonadota bacterium]
MDLKQHIRSIPDFPEEGILFYDISTLLAHAGAWRNCVDQLTAHVKPLQADLLVGIESRGFLTAAPLALELGCGFAMIRKKGKLPGPTISHTYDLEYGSDTIEIQADAIEPGQRIVIMDDLLATGGTASAAVELIRNVGGAVAGASFIVELSFLLGRSRLESLDIAASALVTYDK